MDIYDVPITEVIEQYLAYISTLQAMRLEVAGEYMVMASQLMLIKSRKLLPKVAEVTDLEDDLEQDLLSQIEEYRKFKLLGEQLEVKHQERAQYYSKAPTELIYEDAELVHDKTTIDLFLSLFNLTDQEKGRILEKVTQQSYEMSIRLKIWWSSFEKPWLKVNNLCLQDLFKETKDLQEVITLFLATLELIKTQEILLIQKESFGDIYLMKKNEENQVEQSQAW